LPAKDNFDVEIPEIAPEDLVLEQSASEIYHIARATMPEIHSAELRINSSRYGVKAARGNLYPRLSLSGSMNTNYSSASENEFVSDGGFRKVETAYFVEGTDMPIYGLQPTGTV